jgi:GNAT superfamily N-acetyltransferase
MEDIKIRIVEDSTERAQYIEDNNIDNENWGMYVESGSCENLSFGNVILFFAVAEDLKNNFLGWVCIWQSDFMISVNSIHYYVSPVHRRKGIGRKLKEFADLHGFDDCQGIAWNHQSFKFFTETSHKNIKQVA